MKKAFILFCIPIFLLAKVVKVDDILTDENKIQTDVTLTYINIQKNSAQLGLIEYQTNNGDFVTVPTYTGGIEAQTDRLNYGLGLRYGVTNNLEIFTFSNLSSSIERSIGATGISSSAKGGFNSFGVGATYQVRAEDSKPALLIGGTVDLLERDELLKYNCAFKSGSIFLTSFYTVDPIVFLIKAAYGHNIAHESNSHKLNIGNTVTINPQIYFAVNPYTSLNWGVRYQFKQKDSLDGVAISNNQSQLDFLFGMSYEVSQKSILSIDIGHASAPSHSQGSIGLNFTYKF